MHLILCCFYFPPLFVKLQVWNRSTAAWNPRGAKPVYCHWCIVIHQASILPYFHIQVWEHYCWRERFTPRKWMSCWCVFLILSALRERGTEGQGALLYCFVVRDISLAAKVWLARLVLILLSVLQRAQHWTDSPASARYHIEIILWSFCRVEASAKYSPSKRNTKWGKWWIWVQGQGPFAKVETDLE